MFTQSYVDVHARLVVTVHAAFDLAQEPPCLSKIVYASIAVLSPSLHSKKNRYICSTPLWLCAYRLWVQSHV